MRLHAHAVDQSFFLQRNQDLIQDTITLPIQRRLIIIVEQGHARSRILSCKGECHLHEILTNGLEPKGITETAVIDGLVHNIPGIDNARIILLNKGQHAFDIILHSREHGLTASQLGRRAVILIKEPLRGLTMPYQRMSTHRNTLCLSHLQIRNGVLKIQCRCQIIGFCLCLIFLAIQKVHGLHVIFNSEAVKLLRKELYVSWRI